MLAYELTEGGACYQSRLLRGAERRV